ncbi:MAG: SPOR domain-containing protein [Gammaproteobacteria bacterium]|nr:SPOR domain-containing protein [Gammaproteobacteria bacterium]MDD9815835.1 SPOR domain-containing protein [Gammaproteobacteria bacterium]
MPRRRKSRPAGERRGGGSGLGMLFTGMVVGALGASLYFGLSDARSPIGPGIRDLLSDAGKKESASPPPPSPTPPAAEKPQFDFYTILPEIEQVLPEGAGEEPQTPAVLAPPVEKPPLQPAPKTTAARKPVIIEPEPKPAGPAVYMLQAASFPLQKDAEGMRARLALAGVEAVVQKVTIEGRGTFYRVRLGPFRELSQLRKANRRLQELGIRAMKLKVTPRRG